MSLNCFEIEKVLLSLPQSGIIQGFFQTSKHDLYLSIYDGTRYFTIYIDTQDHYNRICLLPEREKIPKTSLGFAQLLNSKLKGFRILKISQYEYARLILIDMALHQEKLSLIIRLWSRGSNILLVDQEHLILTVLKRYPRKNEWPNEIFTFPEKKAADTLREKFSIRQEFDKENINDQIYVYYQEQLLQIQLLKRKNHLKKLLTKELAVLSHTKVKIEQNLDADQGEVYLKYGELLKSHFYLLKKGMHQISLADPVQNQALEIPLKPELSPRENVNKYFTKYKKMKLGQQNWQQQLQQCEQRIETLNHLLQLVEQARQVNDLNKVEQLLARPISPLDRKDRQPAPKKERKTGREFNLSNHYRAYVSRNSKDADEILKNIANGNDYWFHSRDYAGSHVVVKQIKGRQLDETAKKEAAMLALHFSKAKNIEEGDIYFTLIKYLHKPNKNKPGLVYPSQEKNIKIKIDRKVLENILKKN